MERDSRCREAPALDRCLPRCRRITASKHFEETYDQGRAWHGAYMVLWLRRGEGACLRLGVVASRRVGGAVQRNRAKRRLREVYRMARAQLHGDCDVVLVAKVAIGRASWEALNREWTRLARSAGLLDPADAAASGQPRSAGKPEGAG